MTKAIETAERPTWLQRKYDKEHSPFRLCVHCDRTKPTDQMEPLYLCEQADPHTATTAGPSDCCKSCWKELLDRHDFMRLVNHNINRIPAPEAETIPALTGADSSRGPWIARLKYLGLAKKDGEELLHRFWSIIDQRWIEYYV